MRSDRLLDLSRLIAELPSEKFNMDSWAEIPASADDYEYSADFVRELDRFPANAVCKTVACLGGWTAINWRSLAKPDEMIVEAAERILELEDIPIFFEDGEEAEGERWLFYAEQWPTFYLDQAAALGLQVAAVELLRDLAYNQLRARDGSPLEKAKA